MLAAWGVVQSRLHTWTCQTTGNFTLVDMPRGGFLADYKFGHIDSED